MAASLRSRVIKLLLWIKAMDVKKVSYTPYWKPIKDAEKIYMLGYDRKSGVASYKQIVPATFFAAQKFLKDDANSESWYRLNQAGHILLRKDSLKNSVQKGLDNKRGPRYKGEHSRGISVARQ